jgi:hypothetical protein
MDGQEFLSVYIKVTTVSSNKDQVTNKKAAYSKGYFNPQMRFKTCHAHQNKFPIFPQRQCVLKRFLNAEIKPYFFPACGSIYFQSCS